MPALDPVTAAKLINLLGALLLLSVFFMLAARQVYAAISAYAVQSVLLAVVAVVVGYTTGLADLYLVAVFTLASKAILITLFLRYIARRAESWRELALYINVPVSLVVGGVLTILAYFSTFSIPIHGGLNTKPSLSIAVSIMLVGLFLMISRAEVIMQIVGLVTLENGLFLGALTVSYGTPLIVEFGIFFDVLIGVSVMGILVLRIREGASTTSTTDLRRLRG
ncbi:MAG: hydrogenase [Chloroflexota bacterium]